MNQKFLKKLPRYCVIAIICAMTAAAAPAWAFTSDDNKIASDANGNITGKGTIGDKSLSVSAASAVAVGGKGNAASGQYSVAVGGESNQATNEYSATFGGQDNRASGQYSATLGGINVKASGPTSVAIGGDSNDASGTYSVVLGGYNGTASGNSSVAIGGAKARASHSVAIGDGVETSTTQYEVAIGSSNDNKLTFKGKNIEASAGSTFTTDKLVVDSSNTLTANASAAIGGYHNTTSGEKSLALGGYENTASGRNSVVLGGHANEAAGPSNAVSVAGEFNYSGGENAVALGGANNRVVEETLNAVALGGAGNTASADLSVVIGGGYVDGKDFAPSDNVANAEGSVIIGGTNNVTTAAASESVVIGGKGGSAAASYAVAIGGAAANGNNSVAIGNGVTTSTVQYEVAIGNKDKNKLTFSGDDIAASGQKITNIAAGQKSTDAANVGQLITVTQGSNITLKKTINDNGSTNYEISATGGGSGGTTYTAGKNINFSGTSKDVINLEDNIQLTKDGSVTIGTEADDNRIIIGQKTRAGSAAIVNRSITADGKEIFSAVDSDSLVLAVSKDGGIAQENGISAKGMEVLDKTEEGKVVGATVNTRSIGIAVSQDGKLSHGTGLTENGIEVADNRNEKLIKAAHLSSEAALVSKLSDEGNYKQSYMDGDGYYAASGSIDNPDRIIAAVTAGKEYEGKYYEAGLHVLDKTKNMLSSLTTSELTVANKTYIDKNGINANDQKIINVANGEIAENSKDAVNGGQLWDTYNRMNTMSKNVGNRLNTIDNNILNMNSRLNDMYDDLSGVGSQAAAMSALQAIPYNPYAPTTVTAGLGFYRSDQAVAVGVYHYIRDSVLVNVGGAFNLNGHGDAMGRAGISFALGKGAGKGGQSIGRDVTEMQNKMNAMQNKIDDLEALVKELKKALDEKK